MDGHGVGEFEKGLRPDEAKNRIQWRQTGLCGSCSRCVSQFDALTSEEPAPASAQAIAVPSGDFVRRIDWRNRRLGWLGSRASLLPIGTNLTGVSAQ